MERIAFCFGKESQLPVILGFNTIIKEEHVFLCKWDQTFSNTSHSIVHRKVKPDIDIFNTYASSSLYGYVRGYVYKNGKEYEILDTRRYASLQIEDHCYDNISVIRLENNIFEDGTNP